MTVVQINGVGFETATLWTIDRIDISFTDTDGGSTTFTANVYDPSGPNAGNDTPGMTIDTWNDTQIEISFDNNDFDPYVADVSAFDETLSYSTLFDVNPDAPTEYIAPPPTITTVQEVTNNNERGDLQINGTNLSGLGHVVVYYNSDIDSVGFTNPAGGPLSITVQNDVLAGETVSSIELYETFPLTNLLLTFSGGNLPYAMSEYPYLFSYNSGTDDLTVVQSVGYDFNDITTINYNGDGGSGQLTTADWMVVSPSEMIIQNASVNMGNATEIYSLQFRNGPTIVDIFDFSYQAITSPTGPVQLV